MEGESLVLDFRKYLRSRLSRFLFNLLVASKHTTPVHDLQAQLEIRVPEHIKLFRSKGAKFIYDRRSDSTQSLL